MKSFLRPSPFGDFKLHNNNNPFVHHKWTKTLPFDLRIMCKLEEFPIRNAERVPGKHKKDREKYYSWKTEGKISNLKCLRRILKGKVVEFSQRINVCASPMRVVACKGNKTLLNVIAEFCISSPVRWFSSWIADIKTYRSILTALSTLFALLVVKHLIGRDRTRYMSLAVKIHFS